MSVVAILIGLTLSIGLGPLAPTKAHAAGYCNIYPPSRVAVWNSFQQFSVSYGEGCEVSGVDSAYWGAVHPTEGTGYVASWTSGAKLSERFDFYGYYPLGRLDWQADGAYDQDFEPADQNEAVTTIKLGSVSYVSVKRSGGYHEVLTRTYHYSPNVGAIVPSGNRPGQLQFRTPGSSTWRPVAGVRMGGNGQATVRTWSPGPRYYRVSFGEQPTIFATISAEVRAR